MSAINSTISIELGLFLAIIVGTIALMTYTNGRQRRAEEKGATLEGLSKDIAHITKQVDAINISLETRNNKHDDSIRRLHDRIDEHILRYHTQEVG